MAENGTTLYLIDISSFIFRAFYAIRSLTSPHGEPTNAVYGVATMLLRLIEETKPQHLAIAYDSKEPTFRKEWYPEYKANRSAPPEELVPQFARIEQLITALKLPAVRQSGIEADDLIATLAREWLEAHPSHRVVIATGDKDLMALVNDRLQVWDTMNNKHFGLAEVEEKFGVPPGLVRDYLAVVGDSSDNIPGVKGIGPKGAVDLLLKYGSLEASLAAAARGEIPGKKGAALVEHADEARLSQRLATLKDDCSMPLRPEDLKFHDGVPAEAVALFEELGFSSLVRKYRGGSEGNSQPEAAKHVDSSSSPLVPAPVAVAPSLTADASRFRTISTEAALDEALALILKRGEFGFDLETTSVNPRAAELVGVALCADLEYAWYIPVGHRGTTHPQLPEKLVLEKLRPLLEDPRLKKIGQNLKYDWSVLQNLGLRPDGIGADTMIAAYVLNPEAGRYNLEALAAQYLGYTVVTYEEVCGKGPDQIGFDQVPVEQATRYSAEDAWIAVRLWEVLRPLLQQEHLMEVFAKVDLPLVPVLARMESEGVCIDEPYLRQLSTQLGKESREIEAKIAAFTQGPVNLNSPKQLAHLLFEQLQLPPQGKTKTGFSTDASVLEALAPLHEVPALLLEYREISKLRGTYVDPLPGARDPKTGKVHTSFRQTGTATGRLSSSDPNLQNIPIRTDRGRMIRKAFIPSPGNVLFAADYSQIELRLLAHMSGDTDLVRSFKTGEDVHRRTAAEIFGLAPEAVDDRSRGIAKAINFGLMYGKTAFGLSQELKITRKEAQETIDRYFQRYSGVKHFLDHQIQDARERGFTVTLLGRKRPLPDIHSKNAAVRANAERMAMNAPIQGTAADLMKLAMIEIDHELRVQKLRAKLILQVHDEVVLDVPTDELDRVEKLVAEKMEGALALDVPLVVNCGSGLNWMDL